MGPGEFEKATGEKHGFGAGVHKEDDGTFTAIISFYIDGKEEFTKGRKGFKSENEALMVAVEKIEELGNLLVDAGVAEKTKMTIVDHKQDENMVH